MTPEKIELHKRLQGFYGEIKDGDLIWCNENSFRQPCIYNKETMTLCPNCIRLPLPIDPVNPERGLLGMLQNLERIEPVGNEFQVIITTIGNQFGKGCLVFRGSDPETALLKALCEQEGV